MAIDPSRNDLERFLGADDGQPFVMLNLLRFREDGGRERYARYAREMATILPRYSAEVVYAGDGEPPLAADEGQAWDAVVCVRYPSRESFATMVTDPDYQRVAHLRHDALAEAVLQPTTPW